MTGRRRHGAAAACLLTLVLTVACGQQVVGSGDTDLSSAPTRSPQPETKEPSEPEAEPSASPLEGGLQRADVLVTAPDTLPEDLVEGVRAIKGVAAVEQLSFGSAPHEGRALTIAGVDPAGFRRFTPVDTAMADDVWQRVQGGEVAVDPSVPRKTLPEDTLAIPGADDTTQSIHIGAYAPLSNPFILKPTFSAVVSREQAAALGLPVDNALLVSTGDVTPSKLAKQFERVLGDRANLQILALEFENNLQLAVLTGASVSAAVGSFSYRNGPDGTVIPDPAWVREYIRTESVPILGNVTCNKAMLPQLRAAFTEIVQRGLSDKINPGEYAGCYYPRYIGRSSANGLSLHSWGIAVDLNVPGNLRGTVGEMDRTVVAIFKKWGFGWGGDWSYTDPMHFEMNRVVQVG